jgi:hypothetical protein
VINGLSPSYTFYNHNRALIPKIIQSGTHSFLDDCNDVGNASNFFKQWLVINGYTAISIASVSLCLADTYVVFMPESSLVAHMNLISPKLKMSFKASCVSVGFICCHHLCQMNIW